MKVNMRFSKHRVLVILAVVLVLIAFGVVIWAIDLFEKSEYSDSSSSASTTTSSTAPDSPGDIEASEGQSEEHTPVYLVGGKRVQMKQNIETVLFLGLDKYLDESEGAHINNQQADTLLLAVLDHEAKQISILPINRDTMTQVDTFGVNGDFTGSETMQIALSHAYFKGEKSSCENAVKAVSHLLYNVSIDHYVSLKMDAIPYLNDIVGGVELELSEDFTDLDSSFTKGSTVTLKGQQALSYVRSRQGTEEQTNVSRMERQNQYIDKWSDAFIKAYGDGLIMMWDMYLQLSPYMFTDLTDTKMDEYARCLQTYQKMPVLHIEGESKQVDSYMQFHVNEEALVNLVVDLFYVPVEE